MKLHSRSSDYLGTGGCSSKLAWSMPELVGFNKPFVFKDEARWGWRASSEVKSNALDRARVQFSVPIW